jgi:hypothetical protein
MVAHDRAPTCCLDVTMSEDSASDRMDNGPQNLAVLRHMAFNVMRKPVARGHHGLLICPTNITVAISRGRALLELDGLVARGTMQ